MNKIYEMIETKYGITVNDVTVTVVNFDGKTLELILPPSYVEGVMYSLDNIILEHKEASNYHTTSFSTRITENKPKTLEDLLKLVPSDVNPQVVTICSTDECGVLNISYPKANKVEIDTTEIIHTTLEMYKNRLRKYYADYRDTGVLINSITRVKGE